MNVVSGEWVCLSSSHLPSHTRCPGVTAKWPYFQHLWPPYVCWSRGWLEQAAELFTLAYDRVDDCKCGSVHRCPCAVSSSLLLCTVTGCFCMCRLYPGYDIWRASKNVHPVWRPQICNHFSLPFLEARCFEPVALCCSCKCGSCLVAGISKRLRCYLHSYRRKAVCTL